MGRYCSYLLPKQAGGTPQILLFKTLRMTGRPTVYCITRAFVDVDHIDVNDGGPFLVIFAFFSLILGDSHAGPVIFHIHGKSLWGMKVLKAVGVGLKYEKIS